MGRALHEQAVGQGPHGLRMQGRIVGARSAKQSVIFFENFFHYENHTYKGEFYMINFEEELKKFHPSMDVNEAEDAIYSRDLTDVTDILKEMIRDEKEKKKKS